MSKRQLLSVGLGLILALTASCSSWDREGTKSSDDTVQISDGYQAWQVPQEVVQANLEAIEEDEIRLYCPLWKAEEWQEVTDLLGRLPESGRLFSGKPPADFDLRIIVWTRSPVERRKLDFYIDGQTVLLFLDEEEGISLSVKSADEVKAVETLERLYAEAKGKGRTREVQADEPTEPTA